MVNEYKGGSIDNVENVTTPNSYDNGYAQPKKGGRVKRHCAKWWWLHLIIFLVVGLALTLGLIFGVIPKVGQSTINKSTLEVHSIEITNPSNTGFTFGLNSTIHGDVPVKSHLSAQRLGMYLVRDDGSKSAPFMYLNLTQLELHDTIPINVADYPMEISDITAYKEFTAAALANEKVKMGCSSRPDLYVGSIHNTVNYEKTVTLNGFNGLKGVTLSNVTFPTEKQEDGATMLTDGNIPNPSAFTLEVGTLIMNFNGTLNGLNLPIGYGVVQNLTIRPGNNPIKIRAHTEFQPSFLAQSLQANGTVITMVGNSTVFNGQHIQWLEEPLSSNILVVPSPGYSGPALNSSSSS